MNKGQIFATDMLIGMILIILGIGFLGSMMEFNLYNTKQQYLINEFNQKTETAAITLVNSSWSACYVDGTYLPYSISPTKLSAIGATEIKKRIGLSDYNIYIAIGTNAAEEIVINEITNGKQVSAIDLNILVCHKAVGFLDLNNCMRDGIGNTCNKDKADFNIVRIRVSK